LPPSLDPKSELRNLLTADPDIAREDALEAVRERFPDVSGREFDRLWPEVREDLGMPRQARPGRKESKQKKRK
jgi:hypothetical protein